MIGRLLARGLSALARRLPHRMIHAGDPNDVYLERYYVAGPAPKYFHTPVQPRFAWLPFIVFLHHFRRSDSDRELHSHPWRTSLSLILTGGYDEQRASTDHTPHGTPIPSRVRRFLPGRINVIRATDHHRVLLLDEQRGAWTLFFAGQKVDSWGFLDLDTGARIPWREFVAAREPERVKV